MWDLVGNPEDRFSQNEVHMFCMISSIYDDVDDDDDKDSCTCILLQNIYSLFYNVFGMTL